VVEHLPGKLEIPSSNSSTIKEKNTSLTPAASQPSSTGGVKKHPTGRAVLHDTEEWTFLFLAVELGALNLLSGHHH
jgi:hypothetical protein